MFLVFMLILGVILACCTVHELVTSDKNRGQNGFMLAMFLVFIYKDAAKLIAGT